MDYDKAASFRVEAFQKLKNPMHLIKVRPQVIDFLNSELKADGVSTRQQYSGGKYE